MATDRVVLLCEKQRVFPYAVDESAFTGIDVVIEEVTIESRSDIIDAVADADVVMSGIKLDAEMIGAMSKARGICIFGHGFDSVDVDAATKAGLS